MGHGIGVAPGAHPHAYIAIRADFTPVIETGFGIQFPAPGTVDLFLIIQGNGIRRAAAGALFTDHAKILDPDVNRIVGDQGQVRRYGPQANPRTEFFGH